MKLTVNKFRMKRSFFFGWALALVAIPMYYTDANLLPALSLTVAFAGGHVLGRRNGKLEVADLVRRVLGKGSALK